MKAFTVVIDAIIIDTDAAAIAADGWGGCA